VKLNETPIRGVFVAETAVLTDDRGSFTRFYCERELAPVLGVRRIVQVNQSRTAKAGTVRGMHYQKPPHAEMKFVRCTHGRVWDVALDLRAGSPTFLKWHAEELTGENMKMLCIPEGCAHGVQTLETGSEVLYLHTAFYEPSAEGGVRHDDPSVAIKWPMAAANISPRDQKHPLLDKNFRGLAV
jgi:dTDP-4-dehydrorhamnose 3,5-epimerase